MSRWGFAQSAEAFAVLAAESGGALGLTVRYTDVGVGSGTAAHAVYDGRRALLLPLEATDDRPVDEQSVNVTIRPRTLLDPGTGESRDYLSLECSSAPLFGTFDSLCDEILHTLLTEPPAGAGPAPAALGVLERWRELIGPARSRLIGTAQLAGLLAELHLLERLQSLTGAGRAFEMWAAKRSGARHDFRSGNTAVEVKACTGTARLAVTIHGLTQMEPPEGGYLYLYAEQLEPVSRGQDSVPDCLGRLVAGGMSRLALLDIVGDRGYRPVDEDAYSTVRFTARARRSVRVDAAFPALVPSALVDQVLAGRLENVQYVVDVGALGVQGDSAGMDELLVALEAGL